ncbi:MAG: hypothetical protein R2822_19870 [Spirosomataceae bacterium]
MLVDAWLLAHPNLLGRLGVLFYKYDMIKTFPRALATVGITTAIGVSVTFFVQKMSKQVALTLLLGLTLLSLGLFIHTFLKFSSGTYAMTGAGFKTGALLMPIILVLIFGNGLYETMLRKKV